MKRELSFLLAMSLATSLTGCAAGTAADNPGTVLSGSAAAETTSYNAADALTLTFTDSGITGSGNGVEISGTALTISEPGTYLLTGSCADGSVKVKKGTAGVTLILSGPQPDQQHHRPHNLRKIQRCYDSCCRWHDQHADRCRPKQRH